MSVFNMAAAIGWLDAYRAASLLIVKMYAADATVECACGEPKIVTGQTDIAEYWRQRFVDKPPGRLVDLQRSGADVFIRYRAAGGIAETVLTFDETGMISRSRCWPAVEVVVPSRLH